MWNGSMLEKFQGNIEFHKFCIVLLHGCKSPCDTQASADAVKIINNFCSHFIVVSVNNLSINGKDFKFTLISRRSCKRPGVRLYSRGIDAEGNVSNFVETEQIIEFSGEIASYVQVSCQVLILE